MFAVRSASSFIAHASRLGLAPVARRRENQPLSFVPKATIHSKGITTEAGAYLPPPERIPLGITKIAVALVVSCWFGGAIAKHGAAFLEENDIFVPDDDDDDD